MNGIDRLPTEGIERFKYEGSVPKSMPMLFALTLKAHHVYAGTVPAHVKADRRKKNKAARIARRKNR